nr:hypothetical protein [Tanacetum cinerariifolium]
MGLKALLDCLNGSKRWSQCSTLAVVPLTTSEVRYLHFARSCTNLVEWSCEIKKLGEIKKLEIELWNLRTLDETIELANDLMDQKLRTYAERQNESKWKANDSPRNNQQQPHKKQNVARAYTVGPGEKKVYTGDLPL